MQKTTIALAAGLFLSTTLLTGCANSTDGGSRLISFPGAYKIDIQQGNVVTRKMVNQLELGMTRAQVQYIMGTPLLQDTFDRNRWDYIYSNQPGDARRDQRTVTLFFENDRLRSRSISGDFVPKGLEDLEEQ